MTDQVKEQQSLGLLQSPAFQEISRKSFETHSAFPHISADQYFAAKLFHLQSKLSGKKILYLDTNHWINLRHVVLESRHQKLSYRQMLHSLVDLHRQGRICCPISFVLFIELMKQSDPTTRTETAKLMDHFSDGVCFQFPLEIVRSELRHFLLKRVAGRDVGPKASVWTKVGFLGGELLPALQSAPDATNRLIQKVWTDLMWTVRLEQIAEQIDSLDAGTDFWAPYAAACNLDADFYRSSNFSYEQVLQREKGLLIHKVITDELPSVAQEIWDTVPGCRDPANLRRLAESEYSPVNFPSLQVLAGLGAADMLSRMKFDANDMLDFHHAALAVPYCDVVLCDNPLATRLRNKPCKFGPIYGTRILGRPEEIAAFLNSLEK